MSSKSNSGLRNQYFATIICNIASFFYGVVCAWAGPNFVILTSDHSPLLSGPITVSEASLVVSLICVGCAFGTLCAVFTIDRFGRKIPLLSLAIPQIVISSLNL